MATFLNGKTGRGLLLAAGLLAIVALGPVAVFALVAAIVLACIIELASFFCLLNEERLKRGADVAIMAQATVVTLGAFAAVSVINNYGLWLTMVIVAAVYCENAAAQIFGKKFGHTKLAPRHSPNKTVEGALFGWVGGAIAGTIFLGLAWWLGDAGDQIVKDWLRWLIVVVVAPLLAELGDWLESRMKRLVGVKDSSELTSQTSSWLLRAASLSWLFGRQGGALDKTDSLWFVMMVAMLVLMAPWEICFTVLVGSVSFALGHFMARS